MRILLRVVALAAASALLASCGRYAAPTDPESSSGPAVDVLAATDPGVVTEADLVGTWIALGDDGEPVRGAETASLVLLPGGRATGSDGCSTPRPDRWSLEGRIVTVEGGVAFDRDCPPHDDWLGHVRVLRWQQGALLALGPDGRWTHRLRPATTEEARRVRLELEALPPPVPVRTDVVGEWRAPDGPPRARLVLAEDGTVEGHDGCNRFAGQSWRLDGVDVRTSGTAVTTLAGCVDPVDTWLAEAERYRWSGGALLVLDDEDTLLGVLRRADRSA